MTPDERAAWLAERRKGLGGSDIGAILGISQFSTPFQTWLDKTGREDPDEDDKRTLWGKRLESSIIAGWAEDSGNTITATGRVAVDPMNPIFRCTLDAETADAVVEAKNTDHQPHEPQPAYAAQVLWNMGVTGLPKGYLIELVQGHDLVCFPFTVEKDGERIAELRRIALDWWNAYVVTNTPPPISGRDVDAIKRLFPQPEIEDIIQLDGTILAQLVDLRTQQKEAEAKADELEAQVKMALGNAARGVGGNHKVRWNSCKGRVGIDAKGLAAAHPDIAKQFTKVGAAYRQFAVS